MTIQESEKICLVLQERFNIYTSDLICRAISDESLSVESFSEGYGKISKKSLSGIEDDEYTPEEFKNI